MQDLAKNILSVYALLCRMIDGKLLSLLHHLKRLDIDIIHTPVGKRRRNARKIQPDKEFEPAVSARLCRSSLCDQYLFVHPSLSDHICNGLRLNPHYNPTLLHRLIDVLLRNEVTGNPGYKGKCLISIILNEYAEFLFRQGFDVDAGLFLYRVLLRFFLQKLLPFLLHIRTGEDQLGIG